MKASSIVSAPSAWRTACAALLVGGACAGAEAQLIGKIPEAAAATPDYVPPPPPPPPPPRPEVKPEPEIPLPSLIKKDASDKLVRCPNGPERAVVEAMEFDAETRRKIEASLAARAADSERAAIEKLEKIQEARAVRETIGTTDDFTQLAKVKDVAQPLTTEKLFDRLVRDGAVTGVQRSRLEQVVRDYTAALRDEQTKGADASNINKIVGAAAREAFNEMTRESLGAYDRLVDRLAAKASTLSTAGLSAADQAAWADFRSQLASVKGSELDRRQATDKLLRNLTVEQQKAILSLVAPPPAEPDASKPEETK